MYNSKDTADNLKKAGAFLPGIRPGAHTAEYIDKVLTRLTFWGGDRYRRRLFAARIRTHVLPERAVHIRWYLIIDSGRRNNGLHVANASACYEPAIRGHDAKGQLAKLRQGWPGALIRQHRLENTHESKSIS